MRWERGGCPPKPPLPRPLLTLPPHEAVETSATSETQLDTFQRVAQPIIS